jgi:REP element-mobilizing transposase RayT
VHHVFARGNEKREIYRDDADRRTYLAELARTVARREWLLLAYCLMDNHVHLLVETPRPNLGPGMQQLHGSYAHMFNRRHGRSGHLFQGRYGSVPIEDDAQLWMTVAYVVRNPVEGGLCAKPCDWAWSSHRAMLGSQRPAWLHAARLLDLLAGITGGDPRAAYAELTGYS